MSKQHLILHIGRHKCGTSALQQYLSQNDDILKNKNICYSTIGRDNKVAHHKLASLLNPKFKADKTEIEKTKADFEIEVKGYDTIIISSEAFSNIQNTKLIKDFFSNYHITVVCYFREILDYYVSAYSQKVQATKYASSFEQFNKETIISYQAFEDRWLAISDHYIKKYFHRPYLFNSDIIHDFFKSISIPILKTSEQTSVNKSIGGNLLYLKILLNNLDITKKNLYNRLGKIAQVNKEYSNAFFISDANAERYREMHHKNNLFLEKSCGDIHYKTFTDKPLCPNTDKLMADLEFFKESGLIYNVRNLWNMHTRLNS